MNPFEPPSAELNDGGASPALPADELAEEAAILPRWERLRVVYNGVLTAEVVLLVALLPGALLGTPLIGPRLVLAALAANALYCAGPVGEWYFRRLFGARSGSVTVALFVAGTALAALLAAGYLFVLSFARFNAN